MSLAGDGTTGFGAAENVHSDKHLEPPAMDGSSSSKVTVEYHDPSGLFPLVQGHLTSRFPLRNLHWKSPNRPLRSIDSLHVDLVPSQDSVHISGVTSPGVPPPDVSQNLTPGNRNSGPSGEHIRPPSKERRHQIPGLRQTPYLKVFLLRCDDSDTYKSTARKQLREWVKTHTPPSQSSSSASTQENHDAFEWMILHVVLPDTPAASQPRGSTASAGSAGEKEKVTATSRWTRGTTTILEKIRADFNISSKTAPDRVAQVRLQKEDVPPHMLSSTSPAATPPITESPQEQEMAWNDVIVKFKTLILLSFDLRVRQYEEDIKEKDSQRVLPGWNFCTFFILKEGLARGFESAGLVEDSLLGYDELSVGLDSVIRDQSEEGNEGQGGRILPYTQDIFEQASRIYERTKDGAGETDGPASHFFDANPIDWRRKNYRDLILSNNISIFEFRCYVFARQMSLLLRLGNAHSARSDLASKLQPRPGPTARSVSVDDVNSVLKSDGQRDDSEDLLALAELCSRALNFLTFAGRLLREDLTQGAKANSCQLPEDLVNNLVHSWTFAALQQVLDETTTIALPVSKFLQDTSTSSSGKMQPFGEHNREQKLSFAEPKTMIHPTRSSSLQSGRPSSAEPPYAQTPPSGQVIYENGQYHDRPVPGQEMPSSQMKTGLQELAAARAQLHDVQRRILAQIGASLGWVIGWTAILPIPAETGLTEIDLDGNTEPGEEALSSKLEKDSSSTSGLVASAISNALSSVDQFRQHYEALSDLIVKHYMSAGQVKAAESILGDLAALRYEMGDYAAAAMYFGRMTSSFGENRWNLVEGTMLRLHAQCLKKLNRKDEYIRTLLDLLRKSAANKKKERTANGKPRMDLSAVSKNWLDDDRVETTGILSELVEYSEQLPYDRTVAMDHYFEDISVDPHVRHYEDRDGFQLRLQFRHLLEDEIQLDRAKLRLTSASSTQGKEIWLESTEPINVKKGQCRIWLGCNVNTIGPYTVDKIIVSAKRIVFSHDPVVKPESNTPLGIITSVSATTLKAAKKLRIFCYPRVEAFQARIYASHFIHIDQRRSIEVSCSTGWNNVQSAEIRLKSGSAGLRLRTADASVTSGDVEIQDNPGPGVIATSSMAADASTTVQIPYEIETMLPEISVKIEVEYVTAKGKFLFQSSFTIPIELPLDVNVHDHFKNDSLYSKFNIKTASHMPLEIIDVNLSGSETYEVYAPSEEKGPTVVFPKQPMAVTYKITTKGDPDPESKQTNSAKSSLALTVIYRVLQEDVLDRLCELFTASIGSSPVKRLARLLLTAFKDRLEHRVLPWQLGRIPLLEKVELGPFEEMNWFEYTDGLPQDLREEANNWLQTWHQEHASIIVPTTGSIQSPVPGTAPSPSRPPRRIVITVSVPQTHIVHTASLSLITVEKPASYLQPIAVAGQPLSTTLRIKHTRRWGARDKLPALANIPTPDAPIEFVYTVEAHPETWLVAGQRRAHFSASEDEEYTAHIVLIPLKSGNALLPNVDIRPRVQPKAEGAGEEAEQLNCETDYLSYGESVMVVPDVSSCTVGIGDLGVARSTVWLE